ncbi:MAG: OpgC domain-containing protein [Pseudomonadota bacterium]
MKRDLRLDTLRGLMLVSMATIHLTLYIFEPLKPLVKYIFEPLGFVSSAEGFIFISGIVAGIVYGGMSLQEGQLNSKVNKMLRRRAFQRAGVIYFSHMFIFVVVLLGVSAFGREGTSLLFTNKLMALVLGSILLYQPTLMDILPMYCLFVLLIPFLIKQFKLRRELWILLSSAAIWVAAQMGVRGKICCLLSDVIPVRLGYFDIFAWHLLFIFGVFIGFWRRTHKESFIPTRFRLSLFIACMAIGSMLFIQRHDLVGFNIMQDLGLSTCRTTLALLRLLNFIVIAYLISRVGVRFPKLLSWRWLSFLGQHSLQVFTFQILVVFSLIPLRKLLSSMSLEAQVLAIVFVGASLTLPAFYHKRYRGWSEQKEGNSNLFKFAGS